MTRQYKLQDEPKAGDALKAVVGEEGEVMEAPAVVDAVSGPAAVDEAEAALPRPKRIHRMIAPGTKVRILSEHPPRESVLLAYIDHGLVMCDGCLKPVAIEDLEEVKREIF